MRVKKSKRKFKYQEIKCYVRIISSKLAKASQLNVSNYQTTLTDIHVYSYIRVSTKFKLATYPVY